MNKPLTKPQEIKPVLHTYRKSQPLHLPAERRECDRRVVHERCDIILTVLETPESEPPPTNGLMPGIVTDVSPKGVGLNLVHRIEAGSVVEIEVRGSVINGKIKAKVIWSTEIPTLGHVIKANPRSWRAGVEVIMASDEEKEFMQKLVSFL